MTSCPTWRHVVHLMCVALIRCCSTVAEVFWSCFATPGPHHQSTRGAQPSCSPVFRLLRLLFPCRLRNTRYADATHSFSIAVNSARLICVFFLFCLSESFASEILSSLCSLVETAADKNTCTRALWVISKQNFPQHVVAKKVRITLVF